MSCSFFKSEKTASTKRTYTAQKHRSQTEQFDMSPNPMLTWVRNRSRWVMRSWKKTTGIPHNIYVAGTIPNQSLTFKQHFKVGAINKKKVITHTHTQSIHLTRLVSPSEDTAMETWHKGRDQWKRPTKVWDRIPIAQCGKEAANNYMWFPTDHYSGQHFLLQQLLHAHTTALDKTNHYMLIRIACQLPSNHS